jgi:uncharacterized protein (TIGR02300 family)
MTIFGQAARFDRGICLWQGAAPNAGRTLAQHDIFLETTRMVKPEWGTKRTCPKCSTRFYDLGKEDPVHCIECGTDFIPEPVLKSKQPLAFEAAAPVQKEPEKDDELAADDLAIDEDAEPSADEEVDLDTGDDDLGVETAGEDEES